MSTVDIEKVTKRFGHMLAVDDLTFDVPTGSIISLLGPSGCGKTTTLRLIAGFEMPDSGTVRIGGKDMAGKRPYERNVGLLFQDYALFPHMPVEQNVTYGLRHRGFAKAEIPRRAADMLALVKLTGLERRYPNQLSGGQQQRVALARALATQPEVMLLDEPLSALDAKLRHELRIELKEILGAVGSTTIVVTHDQEEAMSLAERVLVMNAGRVMQQGTPAEIYSRPSSKFVAEFIGQSNWFKGRLGGPAGDRMRAFVMPGGTTLRVPAHPSPVDTNCEVCVRPEHIDVQRGETAPHAGADRNRLRGTVFDVSHLGADLQLIVDVETGERVIVKEINRNQPLDHRGDAMTLSFEPEHCIVLPSEDA